MVDNQEYINNSPTSNNTLLNNLKIFIQTRKKTVLVLLGVVLIGELVWAIPWVKSAKTVSVPVTSLIKIPKEHIASLSLSPQDITTRLGDQFTVKVYVDTKERKVNGVDAIVVYDPKVLEVVGQPTTGDLFTSLLVNTVDPARGQVILTGSRLSKQSDPLSGSGTLANISFASKTTGTTKLTILFDHEKTSTSNIIEAITSNNILTDTSGTTIQISQ